MGNTETTTEPTQEGVLEWTSSGSTVVIGTSRLTLVGTGEDATVSRWLIIALIMALIQVGTIWGIIISWAFNLLISRTLILISILEVGVLISAIMLLIIFFQFRSWAKKILIDQAGYTTMVASIGLEIASLVAVLAEFITRLVLRIKCNGGTGDVDCNTSPTITISTVMLTLNSISIFTTIMAIAVVFVLLFKLRIYTTVTEPEIIQKKLQNIMTREDDVDSKARYLKTWSYGTGNLNRRYDRNEYQDF